MMAPGTPKARDNRLWLAQNKYIYAIEFGLQYVLMGTLRFSYRYLFYMYANESLSDDVEFV